MACTKRGRLQPLAAPYTKLLALLNLVGTWFLLRPELFNSVCVCGRTHDKSLVRSRRTSPVTTVPFLDPADVYDTA